MWASEPVITNAGEREREKIKPEQWEFCLIEKFQGWPPISERRSWAEGTRGWGRAAGVQLEEVTFL